MVADSRSLAVMRGQGSSGRNGGWAARNTENGRRQEDKLSATAVNSCAAITRTTGKGSPSQTLFELVRRDTRENFAMSESQLHSVTSVASGVARDRTKNMNLVRVSLAARVIRSSNFFIAHAGNSATKSSRRVSLGIRVRRGQVPCFSPCLERRLAQLMYENEVAICSRKNSRAYLSIRVRRGSDSGSLFLLFE